MSPDPDVATGLTELSHRVGLLDDRLAGVGEALDRVTHEGDPEVADDYRGDLQQLTEALEAIGHEVAEIGGAVNPVDRPGSGGRAVCWVDLDREEADTAWGDLVGWLEHVLLSRYPAVVGDVFVRCWYRHPSVVEHLSWLQACWVRAYRDPDARPTQAAEWHARWLPTVVALLREIRERCGAGHRDSHGPLAQHGPAAVLDDGELHEFWRRDVAHRAAPRPEDGPADVPGRRPRPGVPGSVAGDQVVPTPIPSTRDAVPRASRLRRPGARWC